MKLQVMFYSHKRKDTDSGVSSIYIVSNDILDSINESKNKKISDGLIKGPGQNAIKRKYF